jgi:hypothetical protein
MPDRNATSNLLKNVSCKRIPLLDDFVRGSQN